MPIDMSAAKAPPVKRGPGRPRKESTPSAPSASLRGVREEGLNGIGQLGQGLCMMGKQYADAATIGMYWGPIARELAVLADTQPIIANVADTLTKAGPYAALIAAVLPFGMQLAANHGLINAQSVAGSNIVPPEVLEARMKADYARMQAEAMRAQQEAMQEAQDAQREYETFMAQQETPTQRLDPQVNHNGSPVSV